MSDSTATGNDLRATDSPRITNFESVEWKSYSKGRFGCDVKSVTSGIGAKNLDCTLIRLAPGQVNGPYHYHHVAEEHFIVLEGNGVARLDGREIEIGPNDVIVCPTGPTGAHQFTNTGTEPLVYLAISTEGSIDIGEYPDSDKLVVFVDGVEAASRFRAFRRESQVEYWDREN